MGKIFISYRRKDSPYVVQRAYDELASVFGRESIFMDLHDIQAGSDFVERLDVALKECKVMLAIIGDKWLTLLEKPQQECCPTGNTDYVFLEITTALVRKIPVIPVLVDEATMPQERQLPAELHQFSRCDAREVRSGRDFETHLKRLVEAVESWIPKAKPSGWEKFYLRTLIRQCGDLHLELIAGKQQNDSDSKATISDVFTKLFLRFEDDAPFEQVVKALNGQVGKKDSRDSTPIEAVEAAAILDRLVILGHPGGGKSALVNHLSVQLAKKRLDGAFDAGKMPGWDNEAANPNRLPVRVILRQFASWLPETAPAGQEDLIGLVWQYLRKPLTDFGCEEYYPALRHEIIHNGAIIFFDGLDEVSTANRNKRRTIVTAIKAFSDHLRQSECSIIITCREYAYQKSSDWRLPDQMFPVGILPLFRAEQIEGFITIWYQHFSPRTRGNQPGGKDLIGTIREWKHLQDLAQYPLLLTLMALVHSRFGKLPEDRAHLYDLAVELLLEHWDNSKIEPEKGVVIKPGQVVRLGFPSETLRAVLADVALAAHERQESSRAGEDAADIPWSELLRKLGKPLPNGLNDADKTIDYLQKQAGLLVARDNDTYAFPHRTFQEFLAAEHMCKDSDFVQKLRQRVLRNLTWWREVFLLAAGISGKETPRNKKATPQNIVSLVQAILPEFTKRNVKSKNQSLVLLASQAMWENNFQKAAMEEKPSGPYFHTLDTVQKWLLCSLEAEKKLTPKERADAGVSLACLGDPRTEVMSLDHMQFCCVPAGAYYARDDESSPVDVEDYWISRYPVTNAQYREFIVAGGYAKNVYWKGASAWRNGKYDERAAPVPYGLPFEHPNHPAVGVSWHEAFAFTLWLTEKWLGDKILPSGYVVRLPTETEWEKAARGGLEIVKKPQLWTPEKAKRKPIDMLPVRDLEKNPQPRRIYPWGKPGWGREAADPNRMNHKETNIIGTSAVGCFPGGVSPYGCEEMVGNAMEWCFDKWAGGQDGYRVSRGGGFSHIDRLCNLTQRRDNAPHGHSDDVGFRLVISAQSRTDLVTEEHVMLSLRQFIEFLEFLHRRGILSLPPDSGSAKYQD